MKTTCLKDEITRLKVRGDNCEQITVKRWNPLPSIITTPFKGCRKKAAVAVPVRCVVTVTDRFVWPLSLITI